MSKKLVGGDYLLDLSSIEIEQSEDGTTKTNITDANVLEQLTNLKKYVPNPQMAKPVWVKLKNGENDELVIARGTFAVVDTGEFEICVQLDGYKLIIYIEFTQVTLDDNTPIDDWYIATNDAKYLFTSDAQNIAAIIGTGEIDNAKPLYFHPIAIGITGTCYLTMIIINNDSTPFTRSSLVTYLKSNVGRYLINGSYKGDDFYLSPAYVNFNTTGEYANILYLIGIDNNGLGHTVNANQINFDTIVSASNTFEDGVNKIN